MCIIKWIDLCPQSKPTEKTMTDGEFTFKEFKIKELPLKRTLERVCSRQ